MKVAVMNFSGNVGKSTVSKYLLQPRIPGATLLAIETINADEGDAQAVRGNQFGMLQEQLMELDSAVVDIGASNVEDVMKLMNQYRGSHEDFDAFVIPATKEAKQVRDTISTIRALNKMGVAADRIRVVFNRVDPIEDVRTEFAGLFSFHAEHRMFTIVDAATIYYSELYQNLRALGRTVEDLVGDDTDWRAKLREATDPEERRGIAAIISCRRLALSAKENLDDVYKVVMGA